MRLVKTRVVSEMANPTLAEQALAALAWWREAGVESDFHDTPQDWLAPAAGPAATEAPQTADAPASGPARASASAPPEAPPAPVIAAESIPTEISAFRDWWLSEPLLDHGRIRGRVPPRGAIGAPLMVIVAEPESSDGERLLSGPQGKLLDAMLRAMGIAPDQAYVASALTRHTPMADWTGITALGMDRVLIRHIELAAPKRLLVFGGNILPLLGHDLPISADDLRRFNQGEQTIPLLPEHDLAVFLTNPRRKSGFWQRWLQFSSLC